MKIANGFISVGYGDDEYVVALSQPETKPAPFADFSKEQLASALKVAIDFINETRCIGPKQYRIVMDKIEKALSSS